MSELRSHKTIFILSVIVLALLAGAIVTTVFLWWLGNWETHEFGLTLALRIVWGCWIVMALAAILTRITMFGWYFRRYYRWPPDGKVPAKEVLPRRPTVAPWYKSGAASFSITVVLVSLTGAAIIATAVMWMLKDVTGEWVFWLVFKILGASGWVAVIVVVVTRVSIFGAAKKKRDDEGPAGPAATAPQTKPPSGSAS